MLIASGDRPATREFGLDLDIIRMKELNHISTSWTILSREKSPGPGGFIMACYRKCRAIIREDIVAAFNSPGAKITCSFYLLYGLCINVRNGSNVLFSCDDN
jgi:hypothetical protein